MRCWNSSSERTENVAGYFAAVLNRSLSFFSDARFLFAYLPKSDALPSFLEITTMRLSPTIKASSANE